MGDTTKEYITLINMRNQLRIGFKKNILSLAGAFHQAGLIDDNCHETVTPAASFLTASDKAEMIAKNVIDCVELSEKRYDEMMSILAANWTIYGPLVEKLDIEYANQGGTKKYSKVAVLQTGAFTADLSIWGTEITTMGSLNLVRYRDPKNGKEVKLRILDEIAPDWREIGEILGFSPAEIRTIQNVGAGKTPGQYIRDVFTRWLRNAPGMPHNDRFPTTWQGIHNLLTTALHSGVAKQLKDSVDSKYSDLHKNFDSAPADNSSCIVAGHAAASQSASASGTASGSQAAAKPPASTTPAATTPAAVPSASTGGKRKKLNKEALADWLEERGIDEDDRKYLIDKKVSEILFLKMKAGDKWTAGLSEAAVEILPDLQEELRQET